MSGCSFPQCYIPCGTGCPKTHTDFCKAYLAIRSTKEKLNVQERIQDNDEESRIHNDIRRGLWPASDRRFVNRKTTGEVA